MLLAAAAQLAERLTVEATAAHPMLAAALLRLVHCCLEPVRRCPHRCPHRRCRSPHGGRLAGGTGPAPVGDTGGTSARVVLVALQRGGGCACSRRARRG
jgi:hypothetical protein